MTEPTEAKRGSKPPVPEIPRLSEEWLERATRYEDEYTRNVAVLLEEWDTTSVAYDWLYEEGEALNARSELLEPYEALTELFRANGRDVLAYSHVQVWKLHELVSASVSLLNAGHVVAAASAARAAIESAVALSSLVARHSNALRRWVAGEDDGSGISKMITDVHALIWGVKSKDNQVQTINIVTLLDTLIKETTDPVTKTTLKPVYEQLCNVVHPSAGGHLNSGFLVAKKDGQQLMALRYGVSTVQRDSIGDLCLWAIAWSTGWGIRSHRAGINDGRAATEGQVRPL